MQIRVVKVKSGQELRQYVQLVRSYRAANGVPTHKVVANLGRLSKQEIENLRRALRASRAGQAVVIPAETDTEEWQLRVVANLDYLDVATALVMWDFWKLSELFNRLLPRGGDRVATSTILAPLVIQRCLAPGSKLYAQRWLPTTALPELLNLQVEQFNNTRIHRALSDLDRVDAELQAELPKRYEHRNGAFAALFLDVSDTFFHGRGCEMAQRDRTKEGLHNARKIGIVLLCNEHGYPLRWQVVPGKRRDPQCMSDMVGTIERLDWASDVPLVCDRAMGQATAVARLVSSNLRFVTACRVNEIESYTEDIPADMFSQLHPTATPENRDSEIETARNAAKNAKLVEVDDLLYVKDLGVQTRRLRLDGDSIDPLETEHDPSNMKGGAAFLAFARILRRRIETGESKNQAALAKEYNMTRARITQLFNLLKLNFKLQERLLRGDFGYISERVLRKAVHYKTTKDQLQLLEEAATKRQGGSKPFRHTGRQDVALRLVAYFNPQMFVEQRARAIRRLSKIDRFIRELNERLPSTRRTYDVISGEVLNRLKGFNAIGLYQVNIESVRKKQVDTFEVRLTLNDDEWKRRRRFDGFVLLIVHPELQMTAAEIVQLYRAKDAVEKDFQTIKSVTKIRPVYHHTDPKVRAHVTLCILALLLERTLEHRLRRSSTPMTAPACFERLRGCHLNILRAAPEVPIQYRLTEPNADQRAILRSLRLKRLVDDENVQAQINPRDPV